MEEKKFKENFEVIAGIVNYYISSLQVAGYKVIMNNHNIGSVHNIEIYKYEPVKRKWFWFGCPGRIYRLKHVEHYSLMIPEEVERIIGIFENLLQLSDVDWTSKLNLIP